ncbi:nuclease-related domain-containing protein [Tersicoccus phoenicis]|uniref:nuclease-related domain-containing protein n=1 Tax=Tersicoccus phoenicis TaxID=554083 RepID=UPI000A0620D3|nr:nuclease-related domain-containing protein [Tersicoccus phoenicis]
MTAWIVRRWARYGHERLYAETPGGTSLGYFDVRIGRYHSDDLTNLPLLKVAIRDHLAVRLTTEGTRAAVEHATDDRAVSDFAPIAGVHDNPSEPAWTDLSGTAAGAASRERALAERKAQGWLRGTLARLVDARTDERAWRIGADGEEAVAAQLTGLGGDWRVLHAVRVGERDSDIDHVVIGPAGVFTINAKHHPHASVWIGGDTFMVNGRRVPYVRNSRHEARRAGRLLTEQVGFPVTAVGVIAVMGARKGFTVKQQPADGSVVVVQRRRVSEHLLMLPSRLSPREIAAIYQAARRSTTWR